MSIYELNNCIITANKEIENYKNLNSAILSLNTSIQKCCGYLNDAGKSISTGLIVEGTPADNGKIAEISTNLSKEMNNLSAISGLISSEVKRLTADIEYYRGRIDTLKRMELQERKDL